jgi:hypothetical protein
MEHTAGAQTSPDIAAGGVFDAISGRVLVQEGENRRLDTLSYPLDGRILVSGGAYGKCSINIESSQTVRLRR